MDSHILTKKEKDAYEQWLILRRRISESKFTVPAETYDQQQKRIKYLLRFENFEKFCRHYFGDFIDSDFGWFHKQAIDNIYNHNDGLHILEWAREHAKSIFADVFIPMWLYARGELTGMLLGSRTAPKARILLKDIEAQFLENKRFQADFGEKHLIGSWLQGYFIIAEDGVGFWAYGIGQQPEGTRSGEKRPNYGVVDDADSKKIGKNQALVKEAIDWIKGSFIPCLAIKGKWFVYANNRKCRNGITAHMVGDIEEGDRKNDRIRHIKVFALEDKNHNMALPGNPDARPAWKERYTYEQITTRIEEMGYRNAMTEFFHMHVEDGNIFTEDHIVFTPDVAWDQYDALLTYVDPSFKDSKKNDFKAIGMLGKRGRYFDIILLWIRQDKKSNMVKAHYDMQELVEDFNAKRPHKPIICRHYMEAGFVQDLILEDYDKEEDTRGYPLRIRKDERKKPDKLGRIEDLEPLMACGRIRFVESLRKTKDFVTLKEQFLGFPNGHDDGPDMVEGGVWLLNRQTKSSSFIPRMGKMAKSTKR